MITKIEHKEIVEVIVPFGELINPDSQWNSIAQKMLLIGSPNSVGVTENGTQVKIVNVNYVEDLFFRAIISEYISEKDGFSISWLRGDNQPYVEIEKSELNSDFDNTYKLENDTHYLIPIATYTKGVRAGYTQFDEIIEWVSIYGNDNLSNIYSDPSTVNELIKNYYTPME